MRTRPPPGPAAAGIVVAVQEGQDQEWHSLNGFPMVWLFSLFLQLHTPSPAPDLETWYRRPSTPTTGVPVKLANVKYKTPHFKVNVLLQAHFSRLTLPADLAADQVQIRPKVITLLSACVDVAASSGYLNAVGAMELAQCVTQATWDSDSPLKQIPHFSSEVIQRCQAANVNSVYDLLELEDTDRDKILQYPSVEVTYDIEDQDELSAGKPIVVNVHLEREADEDEEIDTTVIAPFFPGRKTEQQYLVLAERSTKQLHAVKKYSGELQGILLALQAVQDTANPPSHVLFSVDNTSALTHSTDPNPSSGQYLRLAIRRAFQERRRTCVSTTILLSWSPGHVGVVGNEVADLAAKEAVREMESAERAREQRKERRTHLKGRLVFVPEMAELSDASEDEGSEWEEGERGGRSTRHLAKSARLTQLSDNTSPGSGSDAQLPASISALWMAHKQATRARWDDEWRRPTAGRQLFVASPLASRSSRYYDGLSRRRATLLCRLRTGACALNAYRARFDPMQTDLCECGEQETREHLLLTCPLYDEARNSLLKHLRLRKLPTAGLLLGNPSYRDPLLDFLDSTGRFPRLSRAPEVEKKDK
ncbi:RHTO0S03e12178g1_1 [Rhodotorula toruloides]|uniref:RHTO0S03e12178g1_1 n=2 Tax=Rhodotorula toruloides TaxID=5286 RepID=A0A061AMA3_RHOTO|nr:ribonuclease H-like and Sec63 domain containing protein [Rhodotorula toruloides NP11]EMS26144.1 ribonuclease H-like and Sec63 domain containing protein [Rhodotorula toruloides NP11]CDR38686.1 RHTO0S03e12178g1_1 [Rhodotorula toruloides]